jgi:hypothetical protein
MRRYGLIRRVDLAPVFTATGLAPWPAPSALGMPWLPPSNNSCFGARGRVLRRPQVAGEGRVHLPLHAMNGDIIKLLSALATTRYPCHDSAFQVLR